MATIAYRSPKAPHCPTPLSGTPGLRCAPGWLASPDELSFELPARGHREADITLRVPADAEPGDYPVRATLELTGDIPIIMLTAKGEEDNKIQGLEVGADDYITKPFSPRELVARLKAVLRRTAPSDGEAPIEVGGLLLDPISHRVTIDGKPAEMGPTEYRLLQFFMTHQERAYTRGQLLDQVWGGNVYVEERTVDVHIRRLRKALGEAYENLVQTVRGTGYRFSTKS